MDIRDLGIAGLGFASGSTFGMVALLATDDPKVVYSLLGVTYACILTSLAVCCILFKREQGDVQPELDDTNYEYNIDQGAWANPRPGQGIRNQMNNVRLGQAFPVDRQSIQDFAESSV